MTLIPGYKAAVVDLLSEFLLIHGARLKSLKGQRLERVVGVWSEEHGEWWVDAPIVLVFENVQLEFEGTKCMMSLSWNSILLDKPLKPPYRWAEDIPAIESDKVTGRRLAQVAPLCTGDPARIRGLYLKMEDGTVLQLFDNFDETVLSLADEPVRDCRLGRFLTLD